MDYQAKRILLCLRYGIGDVVTELPVLDVLRRAVPRAHITALGAEPAIRLLEGDPRVDAIAALDAFGLSHRWDAGDERTRETLRRWVEEQAFDLFLDVHHVAPPVGDVVWRGVRSLEADEAAEANAVAAGAGAVDAVKEAVRAGWGLTVPADAVPDLRLNDPERAFAARFLLANGVSSAAPIAVSPVASSSLKRWPVERFARAAEHLVTVTGRPVLLFGGPQADAARELEASLPGVCRVLRTGALPLRHVAALLERCGVLLCNDTGLMHMAAAVGTPVVAVFGPTAPRVFLPPNPSAFAAGGEDILCPHRNTHSLHPPACWVGDRCLIADDGCILRTNVEDVVATALAALAGATRRRQRSLPAMAPGA